MNRFVRIFSLLLFFLASVVSAAPTLAQSGNASVPETNYDVVLNLIDGSDGPRNGSLPGRLSDISKQFRTEFPFKSYNLAQSYIGRIGLNGTFQYKSVSDIFGQPSGSDAPTFLEWSIVSARVSAGSPQDQFQIQAFRFGARIPVRMGSAGDAGKTPPVTSYESVGINLDRTSIKIGTPTLVGTLSLPKTNGTIFLVLTINPSES